MREKTFLSLSGYGYVQDVQCHQRDESYVTLHVTQQLYDSQSDDIWIKCRFDRRRFPILAKLDHNLSKNRSLLLKFDAKYSGFQQCYTEMSEHDPSIILQLNGELLNVHDYYIEGHTAFYPSKHTIKKHELLHRLYA